jgi:hypothetical protein
MIHIPLGISLFGFGETSLTIEFIGLFNGKG